MPGWNGSGVFNRVYSWVSDAAAGIDISASRMDTDTDEITSNGFGNCLTRDGQGFATANLPMASFRHTGVGNGVAATDYSALGQVQSGLPSWAIAGGSSDALTATYAPALTSLVDGQICAVRALSANATTTPTFAPNSLTAYTITKLGGVALAVADIAGDFAEIILRYNLANTRWELLNPSNIAIANSVFSTGDLKPTLKTVADTGWVLGGALSTIGNVGSGATFANVTALALYTLIWTNISSPTSNAFCPVTGGIGVSAAADWAALKPLATGWYAGHALGFAGAGGALTTRVLGSDLRNETSTLITANLPPYTPSGTVTSTPNTGSNNLNSFTGASSSSPGGGGNSAPPIANTTTAALTVSSSFAGSAQGGVSTPVSIMQPTVFVNVMIKL